MGVVGLLWICRGHLHIDSEGLISSNQPLKFKLIAATYGQFRTHAISQMKMLSSLKSLKLVVLWKEINRE